MVGITFSDIVF